MKRFDQINVIPFIDIMLVLLVIVLTTATLIGETRLEIDLPDSSSKTLPEEDRQWIRLGVDSSETIFYDEEPVTLNQLETRLSKVEKDTGIILRVDRTVPFQRFVSVLDLLKRQRLDRLSIVAKQQP